MSALPGPLAGKLGLLIPRLASDHDGEIIATVRAIRRTLAAQRLDLHDLAHSLVAPAPRQYPEPEFDDDPFPRTSGVPRDRARWSRRRWARMPANEKVVALDVLGDAELTDWEAKFVASIARMLRGDPYVTLTQKQVAVVDRLLARVAGDEP